MTDEEVLNAIAMSFRPRNKGGLGIDIKLDTSDRKNFFKDIGHILTTGEYICDGEECSMESDGRFWYAVQQLRVNLQRAKEHNQQNKASSKGGGNE